MDYRELLVDTYVHISPVHTLDALTEQDAMAVVPNAPHSIAAIVGHMDFWQNWFLLRCGGTAEPMAQSAATGWPSVEAGSWLATRDHFLLGLAQAAAIGEQKDRLSQPIVPAIEFPPLSQHTVSEALIHIARHNGHHLGQIVTLRQIMGLWPPPAGSWTW